MADGNTNNEDEVMPLSQVLKSFLSKHIEIDPFNDGFDRLKFIEQFKVFLETSDYLKKKVKDSGELIAILELNEIYESLMEQIENLLEEINLGRIAVIKRVLSLANFEAISIAGEAMEHLLKKEDKNEPREWKESFNAELKTIYGDNIKLQDASDVNIEICNELLRIINNYNPAHDPERASLEEEKLNSSVKKCMIYANLFFNLKDAFEYFRYEFAIIERNSGTIKFKHLPEHYYLLRRVGKERFDNHVQEYTMYLMNVDIDLETNMSVPSVSANKLSFKTTNESQRNLHRIFSAALQTAYYHHLNGVRIKTLDNHTIQTILLVISEIQFLFDQLNNSGIAETAEENQDISSIPVFINKKDLVQQLSKRLNIKNETITKILASLSSGINDKVDLWKKPLISHETNYFFNSNALSHLNTAYTTNQLVNKFFTKEKQLDYFRKYLSDYVMYEKIGKKLQRLLPEDKKPLPKLLKDALIFQLETIFIILEPAIIPFPFNSREYHEAIESISEATFILEDKKQQLLQYFGNNAQRKIVCVVATNFPSLSGLVVNECFVLDHFLLSNYFSTGKYKRGLAITGYNRVETRDLSNIKYYSDDLEMSKNFLSFCLMPEPVRQIMLQCKIQEYRIGLKDSVPEIFQDGIMKIPFQDVIWSNVREIEYCLRQLFYFEKTLTKTPEEKKIIEDRIDYFLPLVLSAIAFQKSDRYARIAVLEIFKKVGHQGLIYLIHSFRRAITKLGGRGFRKTGEFQHSPVDREKAQKDLEKIVKENFEDKIQLGLANLELKHSLAKGDVVNILEYLIDILSTLQQRKYSEQELSDYYLFVAIFTALVKEEKSYERFLYIIFLNFIDTLNFNFQYQTAKNFAEEVLLYSFEHQPLPLLGWICQYKCFEKQKNIFDAAFYGALFVTCVELYPDADEELVTHALYNSMLFFRNYHFTEMEDAIYDVLKNFDLSEYDKQKITLSHFSSRLLSRTLENLDATLKDVEQYLDENLDAICRYHDKGALPWLAFLYNFRNLKSRGYFISDINFIEEAITKLEKELDPENLKKIQAQFFPIPELSKEIYKDALIKLFQSVDFNDAAHELENLEPIARNIVSLSLEPLDIESLLLTGFAINDQSLTFPKHEIQEIVPFIKSADKELAQRIQDYKSYVFPKIKLSNGQELIWLFDVFEKVYCLRITSSLEYDVIHLNNWSLDRMDDWLEKISDFSFDDRGGSYFIDEQEQDYSRVLKELNFAQLVIKDETKEIFLYTSFRLSAFPHNLLNIPVNSLPQLSVIHTEQVNEDLKKQGQDFISLYKPIANVISLEWFLENHASVAIPKKDFTIESWIPVVDEDYALLTGYSKLVPLLEETYGIKIVTDLVPDTPFHSTINVFMAHGGKGTEGFRTIYTRNEEGYAIIKENGVRKIFGNGVIAVLFVCHSASISAETFSQKLISLTHQILSLGYKAVVAPSWSLNPLIASVWLEEFLNHLKQGVRLSECVLAANNKVAAEGFNEYHGFYAPTGWAAMHLYGNPNIYFA